MIKLSQQLSDCFDRGGKVWIIGNGGSNAMASHFSEELISCGFPAIALNDPSVITALSNDFNYEDVFARYLKAVGGLGDMLITLSTSGKSKNILKAIKVAGEYGIDVLEWPRQGKTTEEIQNNQLVLIHEVYQDFK